MTVMVPPNAFRAASSPGRRRRRGGRGSPAAAHRCVCCPNACSGWSRLSRVGHLTAKLDPLGLMRRKLRRSRSRTSRSPKRTWTSCSAARTSRVRTGRRCASSSGCCARRTAAPSASSSPTCRTSSCAPGCRAAWRRRATGSSCAREERLQLLDELIDAEMFEQFLQKKFLGAKSFSLEGAREPDPAARPGRSSAPREHGVDEIVLGMAHRGRLNVLANIMRQAGARDLPRVRGRRRPERSGQRRRREVPPRLLDRRLRTDRDDRDARCTCRCASTRATSSSSNPVVQGRVRAKQDRVGDTERARAAWRS